MKRFDCPHCGQTAITALRKSVLGPRILPASCRSCGQKVTTSALGASLAIIPVIAVTVAVLIGVFEPGRLNLAILALAGSVSIALHVWFVPLQPR